MLEEGPHAELARRAAAGEVAFQRCARCGAAVHFPRVVCPSCGGTELGWEVAAGGGTVYSATAMPRRGADPASIVLVDLDEGVRIMTTVRGVPAEAVAIGARVRVAIEDVEGEPAPVARMAAAGG